MIRAVLLFWLAVAPLAGQIQTIENESMPTARVKLNGNFTWLGTNKAGVSACSSNQFAIQTTSNGVVCVAISSSHVTTALGYSPAGVSACSSDQYAIQTTTGGVACAALTNSQINTALGYTAARVAACSANQFAIQTTTGGIVCSAISSSHVTTALGFGPAPLDNPTFTTGITTPQLTLNGTGPSAAILPELAVSGHGTEFRMYGAKSQAASGCISVQGQPTSGQGLFADGSTENMGDGHTCPVMTWQTPTGSGTPSGGAVLALATSAITSTNCQTVSAGTVNSAAYSGITVNDTISWSYHSDPSAVTGYTPATAGRLQVNPYPTTGYVNFKICNPTSGSITPGPMSLNYGVIKGPAVATASTYTYVQSALGSELSGAAGTTVSTSAPITIGSGVHLIVVISVGYNSGSPVTFAASSDNGGSFTALTSKFQGSIDNMQMSYFLGTNPGSATFTSTSTSVAYRSIRVLDFSCSGVCAGLDDHKEDKYDVATDTYTSSAFTTTDQALVLQCISVAGNPTWDASGSPLIGGVVPSFISGTACHYASLPSALGSATATMTSSSSLAAISVLGAFK